MGGGVVCLPTILGCISVFYPAIAKSIYSYVLSFKFYFPMEYTGYFVLGYFLGKQDISKNVRVLIYSIGIISVISCFFMLDFNSFYSDGKAKLYLTPQALMLSISLFVFAKYNINKNLRIEKMLTNLAKLSFGVYLIHPLFYSILHRLSIEQYLGNPMFGVWCFTILILLISFIISGFLHKISICKKFIV